MLPTRSDAGPQPARRQKSPVKKVKAVEGLDALLSSMGLTDRKEAAMKWCVAEAVLSISMIAEADFHNHKAVEEFGEALETSQPLTTTQRGALRDRLYLARDGMRTQLLTQFGFSAPSSTSLAAPPSSAVVSAPAQSLAPPEAEELARLKRELSAADERTRVAQQQARLSGDSGAAPSVVAAPTTAADAPVVRASAGKANAPPARGVVLAPPAAAPSGVAPRGQFGSADKLEAVSEGSSDEVSTPCHPAACTRPRAHFHTRSLLACACRLPVVHIAQEAESSRSVLGSHVSSPMWSPKVAARRVDTERAHAILSGGHAAIPPFRGESDGDSSRRDGTTSTPTSPQRSDAPPTAPTATSTSSGQVLFAPPVLKSQPIEKPDFSSARGNFKRAGSGTSEAEPSAAAIVPSTPSSGFQRRIGGDRANKLAGLSAVAAGAPRGASGKTTRKVYHSTAW